MTDPISGPGAPQVPPQALPSPQALMAYLAQQAGQSTPVYPFQAVPQGTPQAPPAMSQGNPQGSPTATPPASQAPPANVTIPLTPEEFQRYRGLEAQLQEIQRQRDADLQAKEQERLLALAQKGQLEEAFNAFRTQSDQRVQEKEKAFQDLQNQIASQATARVIAEGLSGKPIAGEDQEARAETLRQIRQILAPMFETVMEGGSFVTRDKATGRPADFVLQEILSSKAFSKFFAATAAGGPPISGGSTPPPGNPPQAPPIGSLEAVAEAYRAQQQAMGAFGIRPMASRN